MTIVWKSFGVILVFALSGAPRAAAHPQKPNAAIKATTIAELTVSEVEIRLELEIGDTDREVFRILEGNADSDARRQFLSRELAIQADERNLETRIATVERRPRKRRDEVTGEVIPGPDPKPKTVTYIDLRYPLESRPKRITIAPPRGPDGPRATIGLVAQHLGVPVNDFDFLGFRETLQLDWDDPWNTRFRSPRLKRSNGTPLSLFIYTDRREIRIEIVVRVKTLAEWFGRELQGKTIPSARQEEFRAKAGEFLRGHLPTIVDGRAASPILDRIQLLKLMLGRLDEAGPSEDVPLSNALIGALFVYPVDTRPREVTVGWQLFGDRLNEVPVVVNNGFEVKKLTAENPEVTWRNPHPEGGASAVAHSVPRPSRSLPAFSIAAALLGLAVLLRATFRAEARAANIPIALCLALGAFALLPFGRLSFADPFATPPKIGDEEGRQIVGDLLENVYHAFDFRSEEAVYDTLAKSVSGDLLRQAYLDARRALNVQESGIRAHVQAVNVDSATVVSDPDGTGFVARCRWTVDASVTHWGHTHRRINRYVGEIAVGSEGGAWRIRAMRMLDEQPIRTESTPSPLDTRRTR